MTEQELREKIAKYIFQDAINELHTVYTIGACGELAKEIIALIEEAGTETCSYCGKKQDGAMLTMGYSMAHAECAIRKLNELLDPDWGTGDIREPIKVVGFLAGYVKLVDDPFEIDIPDEVFFSQEAKRCGFTKRSFLEAGWRKVVKDES